MFTVDGIRIVKFESNEGLRYHFNAKLFFAKALHFNCSGIFRAIQILLTLNYTLYSIDFPKKLQIPLHI